MYNGTLMDLSPDLTQGLIHTVYSTFSHNQLVIAYLTGFILSSVLALWKPNRFTILFLLGFGVLGFGFEYEKHFVEPLIRQTIGAMIKNPNAHLRTQRYIRTFLGEILPIVFYVLGWALLYLGIILGVENYAQITNRGSWRGRR